MEEVRVRLRFQSTPLHYAKKCCFLFVRDRCRTVGDLIHLVTARFGLEARGVQLFLDDYLIPPNESSSIVRDNDLIEVRTVEEDEVTPVERANDASSPMVKKAKHQQKESKQVSQPLQTKTRHSDKKMTKSEKAPPHEPDTPAMKKPAPVGVLKMVKKTSATGGVHLTFHSSSSEASSSSSSSSGSDLDEDQRGVVRANKRKPQPQTSISPTQSLTQPISGSLQQQQLLSQKNGSQIRTQNLSGSPASKQIQRPSSVSNGCGLNANDRSPGNRGNLLAQRGRRGRGRGRGRVVGGEDDVLSVKSVVYRSPGASGNLGRGREGGRGRGRGSGWGVKGPTAASTNKETSSGKKAVMAVSTHGDSATGNTGAGDTGAGDTGGEDTGAGDTGAGDTGAGGTGAGDTGAGDTGAGDTGAGDTGAGDTGAGDTGAGDTGAGDTGAGDTGASDTGAGDTGAGDTGGGDSGAGDTIWETSRAGYTREVPRQPQPDDMEVTAAEGEQTQSRETCGSEVVTEETASSRDYSSLPALLGAPRIGDTIAFKVLELSTNCTPEISDYKEAEVVEYDVSNSSVTLRYCGHAQQGDTLQQGSQRSALLRGVLTEEDEEEEKDRSHDNHVTLSLGALLQPKLIT